MEYDFITRFIPNRRLDGRERDLGLLTVVLGTADIVSSIAIHVGILLIWLGSTMQDAQRTHDFDDDGMLREKENSWAECSLLSVFQ